jgi:hypothetical protein
MILQAPSTVSMREDECQAQEGRLVSLRARPGRSVSRVTLFDDFRGSRPGPDSYLPGQGQRSG